MKKEAIVIGASGLIGNQLVRLLLQENDISKVKIFVRKSIGITDKKLEEIIVDFKELEHFKDKFQADALFLCIGTTRKKTPNLEDYKAIDFGINIRSAELAKANNVPKVHLISSVGADSKASNFYLKLKGEIEEALINLKFESTCIYRPSVLIGKRNESRPMETISQKLMPFFDLFMQGKLKKYHSISAKQVAKAMIENSKTNYKGVSFLEYTKSKQPLTLDLKD
ncbi:MAG: NAD-dependent epimerase/dehydratase family protein [Flavobacteriales bacterium]|nr:NAD-dependent epimerase/dehydratase family protein [Crocinitomicaceae bacterium]NBX80364.1 NAD-dependent epimerase/dehydratase family protein [Flavobacteriales bacterium]